MISWTLEMLMMLPFLSVSRYWMPALLTMTSSPPNFSIDLYDIIDIDGIVFGHTRDIPLTQSRSTAGY